jgi:hypothetical protein
MTMADYTIGPIEIKGYNAKPVGNLFFRNVGPARGLAVLLPGLRYTCDMPLLYYPTKLFLQRGFDVLQLHTNYASPSFGNLSPDRQIDWMGEDAWGSVHAASDQRSYDHLVLVGKSIGTLAMSVLVLKHPELRARPTIWLTPLFRLPLVEQATQQLGGPALYVAGSGDNTFDSERLNYLLASSPAEALVYEGADHSLEVPGDQERSLDILKGAMAGIASFIDRSVVA